MGAAVNVRWVILNLVALQWVVLIMVGYLAPTAEVFPFHEDVAIYHGYALELLDGKLPYRDFPMEYPPSALVPFLLPDLFGPEQWVGLGDYAWLFLLQNAVLSTFVSIALIALVSRVQPGQSAVPALTLYALLAVIAAPLLAWRFDLFPAMLTAICLVAVLAGSPLTAGLYLGAAILAKLYPIVLLPIIIAFYFVGGQGRALARFLIGSALVVGVVLVPLALVGASGWLAFLAPHQRRGFSARVAASRPDQPAAGCRARRCQGLLRFWVPEHQLAPRRVAAAAPAAGSDGRDWLRRGR